MRPVESFVEQPIRSLQTMLRVIAKDDASIPMVVPDGIYGQDTVRAVSLLQQKNKIPITGITDQRTWDIIVDMYESALVSQDSAQPIEILLESGQVLSANDDDPYVYLLQSMLTVLSDSYENIMKPSHSGIMDAQTVASVRSFQKLSRLPVNGEVDRLTWKHLVLQFTLDAHHKKKDIS